MAQQKAVSKNVDFTIYNKIRDFNIYVRINIANNIPTIHRDIRIHLLDECYSLVELLLSAIYNKGNIRMKHLISLRVKLSLINVLIDDISDLKIIKTQKINITISKLATIKNIIYGWILNEEKSKQ